MRGGCAVTLSVAELLAGLAFLERHAPPAAARSLGAYQSAVTAAKHACERVRAEEKNEELRETPCDDLELSVRAANVLKDLGCRTLRDVEALDPARLLDRRTGGGKKTAREVAELLRNLGLGTTCRAKDSGEVCGKPSSPSSSAGLCETHEGVLRERLP